MPYEFFYSFRLWPMASLNSCLSQVSMVRLDVISPAYDHLLCINYKDRRTQPYRMRDRKDLSDTTRYVLSLSSCHPSLKDDTR